MSFFKIFVDKKVNYFFKKIQFLLYIFINFNDFKNFFLTLIAIFVFKIRGQVFETCGGNAENKFKFTF